MKFFKVRKTTLARRRNRRAVWLSAMLALVGGILILGFAGSASAAAPVVKASQGVCSALSAVGIKCQLGTIPVGGSATVEITVLTTEAGTLVDTVVGKANELDPNLEDNTDVEETVVLGRADLAVTKSDSPDPVMLGKQITYTIAVTNNGPSTATGVTVTDKLPTGVTFVGCSDGCAAVGNTVSWRLGTLLNGYTDTVKLVVTADVVGQLTDTVTVSANEADPKPGNNVWVETTTVKAPKADLHVNKKDNKDPVMVGDAVTYTITVVNNGPDDATGVEITDTLFGR